MILRILFTLLLVKFADSFSPLKKVPIRIAVLSAQRKCFYQTPDGRWRKRKELSSLKVGDELEGWVVQELLEGKTGPKLFFDVGVGIAKEDATWRIVNGMLRLKSSKTSVTNKKASRLRKKESVTCYVSCIRPASGQLEICLNEADIPQSSPRLPIASLRIGEELVGQVDRVLDYGVLVDVGANRHGLLHIRKVADLHDYYIDKSKGLVDHGLEKGAKIKVVVSERNGKRLHLDFTGDVKEEAHLENQKRAALKAELAAQRQPEVVQESFISEEEDEEAAAWEAFAAGNNAGVPIDGDAELFDDFNDEEDDDEDNYDEDRDIEDALGLGTY